MFKKISKRKEIIILGMLVILLSVFVYFKDPFKGPILPCIFNKITGFYCPGCGMTRAVNSCFTFNFYQAFRFNALLFIAPIMLGLYWFAKYKEKYRLANIILGLSIIIALVYGVLRNIPRFSYLSPVGLIVN